MADKDTASSQIDAFMAKFAEAEYMAALDMVRRRSIRRASAMDDAATSPKGSKGDGRV